MDMSDNGTNFPPQTYSSLYDFNGLIEDEKNKNGLRRTGKNGSTTVNRFIRTANDAEAENTDFWKNSRHGKTVRSPSPHNAFKRWRKANQTKSAINGGKHNSESINSEDDMSFLKFLAINALDLSLPASPVLIKSRGTNWFQLSGHPDSLAPAGPGTVWKKRSSNSDDTERIVYEELLHDPVLRDIVPRYYREVEYQGETFIELQDLLHGFQDPYVIDIKMGTRTFLESEVVKTVPRPDLYKKMMAIDPAAPTEEEHMNKAVTKLRYMQFREHQSSTCSHGFRIEAMKCRGSPPVTDLKKMKSIDDVVNTLDLFLGGRDDVRQRLVARLCEIRSKIEQSDYFKTREVVGSSLFIVYDETKVGIWLIDFAKTNKLPDGRTVNHRSAWVQGNYEEGLLFGFDHLINIIEGLKRPCGDSRGDSIKKPVPTVSVKT
ncbi:inositol-trisphosphate 3-kinase homolog isoform X4 [Cylas formicarius]|uniref:inositol-trisphosphate 3-kinase homolog isoform X4 n=1 Tax=Cylas formicarius TaxID=197179 RepID=UPI00295897C6|nr:inositol-trisphosphate 3-kinase homolog isoform X4 [Cylas formicarius]